MDEINVELKEIPYDDHTIKLAHIAINGMPLAEIVGEHWDSGHLPITPEHLPTLLAPEGEDEITVLTCTCLESGCGGVFAKVTTTGDTVCWDGFRSSGGTELAIEGFTFNRKAYDEAVNQAATAWVSEYSDENMNILNDIHELMFIRRRHKLLGYGRFMVQSRRGNRAWNIDEIIEILSKGIKTTEEVYLYRQWARRNYPDRPLAQKTTDIIKTTADLHVGARVGAFAQLDDTWCLQPWFVKWTSW